jgi:predicted ATP-dependent endonuclease of OLD family
MKLKSFRVTNYRSIIDSRDCYLSPNDGITILAGQNESGKSSLLEALKHYRDGSPCPEAYRDEDDKKNYPKVQCTYIIEPKDNLSNYILEAINNDESIKGIDGAGAIESFLMSTEIKLERTISYSKEHTFDAEYIYTEELSKSSFTVRVGDKIRLISSNFLRKWIGKTLFPITPIIILFDDFFDMLPSKFYLHDLNDSSTAKGVQAVRNIERILGTDFLELNTIKDLKVRSRINRFNSKLTVDFNKAWSQRIADETGAAISINYQQGKGEEKPYLLFAIETREEEYLSPEKRSLGFKWFLSFYLHLIAEQRSGLSAILLFDEPGLHLHSRAQYDMLKIFEELSENNQIIYSTHSPYLIDTDKLHRVRLIFNSGKDGTKVDKITSNTTPNKKEAIKPIVDALGLHVAHDFAAAKDRNVIVEGISDYYYFSAAKKLLGITEEFYFLPAMGASQAHLLMELCMGWGLQWLMIFDDDKESAEAVRKLRANFFSDDSSINQKVYILNDCDGVEAILDEADIKLAQPSFVRTTGPLSKDLKNHGTKELIGRFFSDKVESGDITLDKLSQQAQDHFKKVFAFIEEGFK